MVVLLQDTDLTPMFYALRFNCILFGKSNIVGKVILLLQSSTFHRLVLWTAQQHK